VLAYDSEAKTHSLVAFDDGLTKVQPLVKDLKQEEGKNLKYTLAEKQLIKANINAENGALVGKTVEIINL
jgi:hypothetical protein